MPRGSRIGTREEILATALDLFLAQGYEATSLREIAERLDITKAALYYHFPAKEQLVVELTRQFLNDLADLVATARAEPLSERRARLTELLSAYLDLLIEHQQVIDLLSRNPATQNHPDVGLRARNLIEALRTELAGPDAKAEDKLRVACAMGAISSVAMLPVMDGERVRALILGAALAAFDAEPVGDVVVRSPSRRVGD
ncbi:MAG TPA: helix-turn-helix domain-containing protein [Acidimicrobiales bacterium]|nr:helix-turn-helix domain-containing protein [Acidimicrobiales bacterium]